MVDLLMVSRFLFITPAEMQPHNYTSFTKDDVVPSFVPILRCVFFGNFLIIQMIFQSHGLLCPE